MPFFTKTIVPMERPPACHWGEPRGRVKHIEVCEDGLSAIYMVELPPEQVTYRMKVSGERWEHLVWVPWRYFFIRVRYDSRISGANMGYVFYAAKPIPSMNETGFVKAIWPNVFGSGGICLGYDIAFFDRSPVRSVFRSIRAFYSIPGNQWIDTSHVPREIRAAHTKEFHDYLGGTDYGCRWATLSKEEILTAGWEVLYFTPQSVVKSFDQMAWVYQKERELDIAYVEKLVGPIGGTR